jgi:BMFP domain-containing protein YqiC
MTEKPDSPEGDPFGQMVQFYDDWTKTWAGALSGTASSKGFADTVAQQMEGSLSTMGLVRRQMAELTEQSLQQMSLPTRKDLVNLAQRLTDVEMRLDDMEAKLDEVLDILKAE